MKYVLAIAFLWSIKISYAQEINGIGVIKLGETETQVISDLKIDSTAIIDGATKTINQLVKKYSKSYVKIKFDPASALTRDILLKSKNFDNVLIRLGVEKCEDAALLVIPKYEVAGVTVNYLKLTFYKDTLVRILYENATDLNQNFLIAFKAKYGDGERKKDETESVSIYRMIWKSSIPDVLVMSTEITSSFSDTDLPDVPFGGGMGYSFRIQNKTLVKYLGECGKKGAITKKNSGL